MEQKDSQIPSLSEEFKYGSRPIRGVSLGGWLVLEPFISPSFFEQFTSFYGGDETTICNEISEEQIKKLFSQHYETFVTKQTFEEIKEAGFDHVRIPFPYWAVKKVNDEKHPYGLAWEFLIKGVDWAKEYGLRVMLDLHSAPGNQNGFNMSGKRHQLEFLKGPNGKRNGDALIDILCEVARFFSTEKYQNVVTILELVNEPMGVEIGFEILVDWHQQAYKAVIEAGFQGLVVMSDCFENPESFTGKFPRSEYPSLVLDVHSYIVFDDYLVSLSNEKKIDFISNHMKNRVKLFIETFGPVIVGEWSLADTDCATHLNDLYKGSRWVGDLSNKSDTGRSCVFYRNTDFDDEYKNFLRLFAKAQTETYNQSYGNFFWTYKTERNNAVHWSYKNLREIGVFPQNAQD